MKKLIDEFIEDMRLEGRADGTLMEYRMRLNEFRRYLDHKNRPIDQTTHDDVSEFTRTLFKKCQKITTVRCKLSAIRVFSIWANKKGYMDSVIISPGDYPKNVKVKRIKRLTNEELQIFKGYIDGLQPNARAAFWLLYGSGCRVGEAAHLRSSDVTLRGKAVYIDIKDAKWGSDRCIPIIDRKQQRLYGITVRSLILITGHFSEYRKERSRVMRQNSRRPQESAFTATYCDILLWRF